MRAVGSKAKPEVIQTWAEVYQLFQQVTGERRERLQQVAERMDITAKVAKRRLRNYEAMNKLDNGCQPPQGLEQAGKAVTSFRNRTLQCVDCGQNFTWAAKEQAYYKERGFSNPKRCKVCRQRQDERQAKKGSKK